MHGKCAFVLNFVSRSRHPPKDFDSSVLSPLLILRPFVGRRLGSSDEKGIAAAYWSTNSNETNTGGACTNSPPTTAPLLLCSSAIMLTGHLM